MNIDFKQKLFAGLDYLKLGNLERALEFFQESALAEPSSAEAHYCVGVALSRLGRTEEAAEALERAAALGGNPEHRAALGQLRLSAGQGAKAKAVFEALWSESGEARHLAALGLAELLLKNLDAAVGVFQKLAAESPETAEYHYRLGQALARRGDYGPADEALARAIELQPDTPAYYEELAETRRRADNELGKPGWEAARDLFKAARTWHSENEVYAEALKKLLLSVRDWPNLEELARDLATKDPQNHEHRYLLAKALGWRHAFEESEHHLNIGQQIHFMKKMKEIGEASALEAGKKHG